MIGILFCHGYWNCLIIPYLWCYNHLSHLLLVVSCAFFEGRLLKIQHIWNRKLRFFCHLQVRRSQTCPGLTYVPAGRRYTTCRHNCRNHRFLSGWLQQILLGSQLPWQSGGVSMHSLWQMASWPVRAWGHIDVCGCGTIWGISNRSIQSWICSILETWSPEGVHSQGWTVCFQDSGRISVVCRRTKLLLMARWKILGYMCFSLPLFESFRQWRC